MLRRLNGRRFESRRQLPADVAIQQLESRCLLTSLTPDVFNAYSLGDNGPYVLSESQQAPNTYQHHLARFNQLQRYQTFGRDQVQVSDQFFRVPSEGKIGLRGWAKSGDEFNLRYDADNQQSFGVVAYDADYLPIQPQHVLKHAGSTDTVLTSPLRPGDTSFTVQNATGWSTSSDPATRSLAWFGYANKSGQIYDDHTYTRNVATDEATGLWSSSGVNTSTDVITLNAPWSGPVVASGTAVRNATSGPDHSTIALNDEPVAGDFTFRQYDALIEGIDDGSGTYRSNYLPAGTEHLKVIISSNQHGEVNNQITWREIELVSLGNEATVGDLKQPEVEFYSSAEFPMEAVEHGWNDRVHAADLARSAAFIEVSTDQAYRIEVDMFDLSAHYDHPVAIESFDSDKQLIHSLHVTRFEGATDTRLSRDLRPGDTQIFLDDATGWSNSPGATAESRSLAWYGYRNSDGYTYPDYTYTRNVVSHLIDGMWDPGAIRFDTNSGQWIVQLNEPWAGSLVRSGTAVRNATGHGHRQSFNISTDAFFSDGWIGDADRYEHQADFGRGIWEDGLPEPRKFRPGTAFIKPAVLKVLSFGPDWLRVGPVSLFTESTQRTATFARQTAVSLNRSQQTFVSDQSFVVDTSQRHFLTADLAAGSVIDGSQATDESHSIGYFAFDSDGLPIRPEHVQKYASSTDTKLAFPLRPGDTSIHLIDANGWSNSDTAETRGIAWYGYQNATAHTYPDFSYTRNVAFDAAYGLWDVGAINGSRIQLREPWAGPVLPTGTAIRNAQAGDELFSAVIHEGSIANEWQTRSAVVQGEWANGLRSLQQFPPGTASIRLGGRVNEESFTEDDQVHIRRMTISAAADRITEASVSGRYTFDLDVLQNDADSESLSITGVQAATFGDVLLVPGAGPNGRDILRYTASRHFVGTDQISYTATNTVTGVSSTAIVSVTLNGSNLNVDSVRSAEIQEQERQPSGNQAPFLQRGGRWIQINTHVAESGIWFRADDRPTSTLLTWFADDDGDTLTTRLISGVSHGVLELNPDGSYAYKSDPGFVGRDGFEYEITDGVHTERRVAWISVYEDKQLIIANRLKNIGLAFHNFHDVYRNLPYFSESSHSEQHDNDGLPLLSWRVHLLPFLGYHNLYNQFRLNESWDSAHNIQLIDQMPDAYRMPGQDRAANVTQLQMFLDYQTDTSFIGEWGPGGFSLGAFRHFIDALDHSVLVGVAGESVAVPWTTPQDIMVTPDNPFAGLDEDRDIHLLMANGNVRTLARSEVTESEFLALLTNSGREVVDAATIHLRTIENYNGPLPTSIDTKSQTALKFRQIGLAFHVYHDLFSEFPVSYHPYYSDAEGNRYLSWRVHLLPYLGHKNLYEQFHLDEPWDSPHNLSLLPKMPDIFRSKDDTSNATTTRFQVFTGPAAPFGQRDSDGRQDSPRFRDFTNGSSNTILFIETGSDKAVPWTAPLDIPFNAAQTYETIGELTDGEFAAAFVDGEIGYLSSDLRSEELALLITHDGEEQADGNGTRRLEERRRGESRVKVWNRNRMKTVGLAAHNYHDVFTSFPVAQYSGTGVFGPDGKPNLSWRVHLLPFMEQGDLYQKFNLDEPWDSPTNLPLLDQMPEFFRHPDDPLDSTTTRMQVFEGPNTPWPPGTPFSPQSGPRIREIEDGTSNTMMVVETGADAAVQWTKPDDLVFTPERLIDSLGVLDGDVLTALMFDGSVQLVKPMDNEALIAAMVTPDGGEDINSPLLKGSIFAGITSTPSSGNRLLVAEGQLGAVDVVLDKPGNVTLELQLSVDGVVTPDRTTLQFTTDNWNIPQTITFLAADDELIDDPEVTIATLSVVDEQSDDEFDGLADIVIPIFNVSDDAAPGFHFSADSQNQSLAEGQTSETLQFLVLGKPDSGVTFRITSSDLSEITPVNDRITVTPETVGQLYAITLQAHEDGLIDGTQTVTLNLSVIDAESDPQYRHLPDQTITVIVEDTDVGFITIADAEVRETLSGDSVAQIPVTLDKTVANDVTVSFTTADGTATGGGDFEITTDEVTFPARSTPGDVRYISVPIFDDRRSEGDETFSVQLTAVEAGGTNVQIQTADATVTIRDNDLRGILVSDVSGQVTETGGTAGFQVRLTSEPSDIVTIDVSSSDETEGVPRTARLMFDETNWSTFQSVVIDGVADAERDGEQEFQMILSPATGGDYEGLDADDITLTSHDTFVIPDVTISAPTTVTEGQNIVVTVTLSESPSGIVTVGHGVVADSAVAADFSGGSGEITFTPDGPLSQQVIINTTADDLFESTEHLRVRVTTAENAIIVDGEQVVSIRDNDVLARPELNLIDRFPQTSRPRFEWPAVEGATGYDVWLGRVFPAASRVFAADSQVADSAFTPPEELTPGYYRIWVRARSDHGTGQWSFVRHFEIQPKVIGPVGPTFEQRPVFRWEPVAHAAAYEVYVRTSTGDHVFDNVEGTTFQPATDLGQVHRWWVRPASAIGNRGYSRAADVGTQTELTALTGQTITWNPVGVAGRYVIHVTNTDTRETVVRETHATGTSMTLNVVLPAGSYVGWVKAIDQASDSFVSGVWSRPFYALINDQGTNDPLGGLDVAVSTPSEIVTTSMPLFSWTTAQAADRYQIFINTAEGQLLVNEQVTGTEFTAGTPFSDGEYRVWVRAISSSGRMGDWSAVRRFTVDVATSKKQSDDSELLMLALADWEPSTQAKADTDFIVSDELEQPVSTESAVIYPWLPDWSPPEMLIFGE